MAMRSETPFRTEPASNDVDAKEPASRPRARTAAPTPAPRDPDQEARLLLERVVERARVARSFAKLAAGVVTVSAVRASLELRAIADAKLAQAIERDGGLRDRYGNVLKVARAAAEAAAHVASQRAAQAASEADAAPPGSDYDSHCDSDSDPPTPPSELDARVSCVDVA